MYYLLLFSLFAIVQLVTGQGCSATVDLVPSPGVWQQDGTDHHVYNVIVRNTGTCSFTGLTVDVKPAPGSFIGTSWGYSESTGVISGFGILEGGHSYTGSGFIVNGIGAPSVAITSYSNCDCGSGGSTTGDSTTGTPTEAPPTQPPVTPLTGPFFYVGLKFLILTCTAADIHAALAQTALDSVGTPYDVLVQATWGTADLKLTDASGNGLYYAIVSASDVATCWSAGQQSQLTAYEIQFQVKMVVLYKAPAATSGVTLRPEGGLSLDGVTVSATGTLSPEFAKSAPFYKDGISLAISGVFAYPALISDYSVVTPAVYLTLSTNPSVQYLGAAIINFQDTRTHLEFYFDNANWAEFSNVLMSVWLQWASNGVFAGIRRIELNAQVDDVFMNTGMFNPAIGDEDKTNTYRLLPSDLDYLVQWQNDINARLPAGSDIVLTFPFNGATVVVEKGGFNNDALYVHAKTVRDNFFWESHTYTHPYLDNYSYDQVMAEWVNNKPTALDLFDNDLTNPRFCQLSVITPSITGLFNGNALRAMWDFGIRYLVGDNSRAELVPPVQYHGFYTNATTHGFAGMYVLPRQATNIYYDGSIPADIESQFNYRYAATLGTLDFPTIVQRDVDVAVKMLLAYRWDPYMFHQANMRFFSYNGAMTSLVTYWVDAVVNSLMQYTNLPIQSHKHDDLAAMFIARESRDACGFSGLLKIDQPTGSIAGISMQTSGTCSYAISGAQTSAGGAVSLETYGTEKTIWVDMKPNSPVDLVFSPPVAAL